MTCSGRPSEFHAWTLPCRSLSRPRLPPTTADPPAGPDRHRLPGVDRLLVALVASPDWSPRVCAILDANSRSSSSANRACRTPSLQPVWPQVPRQPAAIDLVYSVRVSPVLCGHYTPGLKRQPSSNFGFTRRFENVNQRLVPAQSKARRVSTLAANKSQNLVHSVSSSSIRP